MKKLLLLFTFLITSTMYSQTMELQIIPVPQEIKSNNQSFQLKKNLIIQINDEQLRTSAEEIQNTLKESQNISSTISNQKGDIILSLLKDAKVNKKEEYHLTILNKAVEINSATPAGVFYGTMSLVQLLEKVKNNKLTGAEIYDYPDMEIRGISDDISRDQVPTLDNFKRIIKHIARHKMNLYMPYLEDMIKFDQFPTIGVGRGALTKSEVKELVAYAKKYYVEIIPVFQTLGHYENILNQDEFMKYAEFPGAASLNVSSDSTYIFLEAMLKEVFEMFPSEYFNMGADETRDVGLGKSKYLVDQTNIAIVHANHYQKVYDICKKYGKKVMMYGDIVLQHPEILSRLPKDITIVDWHYGAAPNYPSTEVFKKAGFKYIVSPAVWNFTTTFPSHVNSIPNIKYMIESGLKNGASGMVNSNWGDSGGETFKELVLYGYSWSAQCAWNFKASDINKFNKDFFYDFYGVDDERAPKLYEDFSVSFNQIPWHDVWRNPLLPFRDNSWWEPKLNPVSRVEWMNLTLPEMEKNINGLKAVVKKNKDHLEILQWLVDLDKWFRLKINTQVKLQSLKNESTPELKTQALSMLNNCINDLKILKEKYNNIWLKYYKKDNLDLINGKFDRQLSYYKEAIDLINTNKLASYSPVLESEWIYVKSYDTTLATKAEFKTTFKLNNVPEKVNMQILGDTYVRVYVNGEFVEKVAARRSLSLTVDIKMIKIVDISKFLRKGENEIKAVVENYNKNGAAGFNIITNLVDDNNKRIMTNTESNGIKWLGKAEGSKEWKDVTSKDYPVLYNAPNLETGRTSWMER